MKRLAVLALVLALSACAPAPITNSDTPIDLGVLVGGNMNGLNSVYRVIDREAGVVCWAYSGYDKGGISCLPLSDTKLGQK